ncbi:hypothetical protein [Chryseobacterium gambrini]|uniref:hypothetical protein n=1 Tax=Chryseobacterium gambrini TaxID=373672 RepID=UPI003D098F75
MKQYDEKEFTLITHDDMKTYQWLIKENIKRNRVNGIISKIIIYAFISVITLMGILMVTKDIFFKNYFLILLIRKKELRILKRKEMKLVDK